MESQTDYRLERWLAVLLSLLFFLPFVARADDIVFTDVYHGEEMPHADGEEFLALTEAGVLVPVKIMVTAERYIHDAEDEATGKRVTVPAFDGVYLIRGKNLKPGTVTSAEPNFAALAPEAWKATFTLEGRTYELFYRCGDSECTLVLESGDVAQDLMSFPIERHGREINTMDVEHFLNFAGDLDHDGRLDLLGNFPSHWNGAQVMLFLSSSAKKGQLVGKAAELSSAGC